MRPHLALHLGALLGGLRYGPGGWPFIFFLSLHPSAPWVGAWSVERATTGGAAVSDT